MAAQVPARLPRQFVVDWKVFLAQPPEWWLPEGNTTAQQSLSAGTSRQCVPGIPQGACPKPFYKRKDNELAGTGIVREAQANLGVVWARGPEACGGHRRRAAPGSTGQHRQGPPGCGLVEGLGTRDSTGSVATGGAIRALTELHTHGLAACCSLLPGWTLK